MDVPDVLQRIARLPWRAKLSLGFEMLQDKRIPLATRAIMPGLLLYLALPIDIVPDFIPVLGQLDDIVIALAAVGLVVRSTPRQLLEEHLSRLEARARPSVGDTAPM